MKYVGIKAHFEGISLDRALEMYSFEGGYLGISTLDDRTVNIACLVLKNRVENSPELWIEQLKEDPTMALFKERISKARMLFPKWLVGEIPEFGIRDRPLWERVFWIGDAAGSIPPVSGEGLAMAITSGCMAADYYLNEDAEAFKKAWKKRYGKRLFFAGQLHKMMLTSWMGHLAIPICHLFPSLPIYFWEQTRETTN